MAKASVSPSASEAESVPERFAVVVSEELAVSAIEPPAGAVMTGASLTAVTDVPRLSVLAEIAVAPPLVEMFTESPVLKMSIV